MNTINVPTAKARVPQREIRQAALRTTGLDVSKDITLASQRLNQRLLSFAINLYAQATHVNIEDIGFGLEAHTPDPFKNHGTRHNAARISAKEFQHCELLRRQANRLSRASYLTMNQIQFEVADAQARTRLP